MPRSSSRIAPRIRVAAYRANGHAPLGVEGWRGLDQGGEAGGGQVVTVDVARHPAQGLADDVADQGHVLDDQLVGARRYVGVGGHAGDSAMVVDATCPEMCR